jgi:hypothetical protein
MFSPPYVRQVSGHDAKAATAADATPAISTSAYRGTLYVLIGGAQASTLTYTLQDSADGTNWATVTAPVNGVDAQTVVVTMLEGETPVLIWVLHSAVRRYHRLLPASGAGDNLAAVAAILMDGGTSTAPWVNYRVGS